ncbi:MAG: type IV pilus assembly protein PilM [Bacillota bacterium]|nr:type IV pilus assembly protein PilM [Bacillota bacterium]
MNKGEVMAVDIGSKSINILVGNEKKINICDSIPTPENSIRNDKIVDSEAIYNALNQFRKDKGIYTRNIAFAIHGQDIIIRHTDIPVMKLKDVGKSAMWEISQFLPEQGKNHYVDYEIVDNLKKDKAKLYKVVVVAAPKDKVNKFVDISQKLGMEIQFIDVASNCVARVFKGVYSHDNSNESIGIIDIGSKSSSFIILDKGKLFMEKEVPFGIINVINEIKNKFDMDVETAYTYFLTKFNLAQIDLESDIQRKVKELFDMLLTNFENVVHFYASGKAKKTLDKIYVIGSGCEIYGIEGYIRDYLDTHTQIVNSTEDIYTSSQFPYGSDFKFYVNAFGLLLRKE